MQGWEIDTFHGTTLFFCTATRRVMHDTEIRPGWCRLLLFASGSCGILYPDCENSEAIPVRIKTLASADICIGSAKCGIDELFYSARPLASEDPMQVVPFAMQVDNWETFTVKKRDCSLSFSASALHDFFELVIRDAPPQILIEYSGGLNALLCYLSLRDAFYVDKLGGLIASRSDCRLLSKLAAESSIPALRWAYRELTNFLTDRDLPCTVDQISEDFDACDVLPHEEAFDIEFELLSRIRQHVESRNDVCVLATIRNEGCYLIEWIAYYISIGVEHFFLYSNDNEDGSEELLSALSDHPKITIIRNDCVNRRPQIKAYGHALKLLPQILNFRWTLVVDADEFVVLDQRFPSLKEYTDWVSWTPSEVVVLSWVIFSAYGADRADLNAPVTRRFFGRHNTIDMHIKSMIKARFCTQSHPHHPCGIRGKNLRYINSNGDPHVHSGEISFSDGPVADAAWINHYWSKSLQEYAGKLQRNGGDTKTQFVNPISSIKLAVDRLRSADSSGAFTVDKRIQDRLPRAEIVAMDLLMRPSVRAAHEQSVAGQKARLDSLSAQIDRLDLSPG